MCENYFDESNSDYEIYYDCKALKSNDEICEYDFEKGSILLYQKSKPDSLPIHKRDGYVI